MKITLQINGQERSYSEEELISKLNELEELKSKSRINLSTIEVAQKPTVSKCFSVDPNSIDQDLFSKERTEKIFEEPVRLQILKAFEEVRNNPQRYSKKFKTFIPEKNWGGRTVRELEEMAIETGGTLTDIVDQRLEWAQRIQNGESWDEVCRMKDPIEYSRLVASGKDYYMYMVGGMAKNSTFFTNIFINNCESTIVPLIKFYEE